MRATVAAALAICAILVACRRPGSDPLPPANEEPEPVAVEVLRVEARSVAEPFETTGNLAPLKRSIVYAEIDGTVAWVARAPRPLRVEVDGQEIDYPVNVDIGIRVKKGDPVIKLNPVPYELAVREAERRLERARRELERLLAWSRPEELERLRAAVRAARAQARLEQATLERYRTLFERGAVSEDELQRQEARAELAVAQYEQALAELKIAEAGPTKEQVEVARAAVAEAEAALNLARFRLSRTVVRAPYDGIITEIYTAEGERVVATPRTQLFEIVADHVLVAQVNVPERYVGMIHPEDRVEVYTVNQTTPVQGIVAFVNGKVDHLTRTFRVRIGVDNRQHRFKPGQYAKVRFRIRSPAPKPAIPVSAVRYDEGTPVAYLVEGDRVRRQPIELGLSDDRWVQVTAGLKVGDLVVVDPVDLMSDGMRVKPQARLASRGDEEVEP